MTENTRPATQDELQKARKAAEAAQAKLAKLEAEEALRRDADAAKRAERTAEYDAAFHSRWRQVADEAKASEGSTDVEYDPETMGFLEGLIRFATGRGKRRIVMEHAQRAESTLGISSAESTVPDERPFTLDIIGDITRIVEREAGRRTAEFADALEAEREAFINGEGK
ncbi:hypothetical protein [Streptomyces sp. NPDC048419]|uniref:hypothetical protein n=1 Tax=Streptomyces sp. NPDC048419 TaxID=3365547 RepID=UPI0037135B2C